MSIMLIGVALGVIAFPLPRSEADERPRPLSVIPAGGGGADPVRVRVQWIGFAPDGRHLGVRSTSGAGGHARRDAVVEVIDLGTRKCVASAEVATGGDLHGNLVPASCAFSTRGDWLAYGTGPDLRFLTIPPHRPDLPSGGRLVTAGPVLTHASLWMDPNAEIVYMEDGRTEGYGLHRIDLRTPPPSGKRVSALVDSGAGGRTKLAVALNPRTHRFATSFERLPGGKPLIECRTLGAKPTISTIIPPTRAISLALSPAGNIVAAGYGDGSVGWYDTTTGKTAGSVRPLGGFTVASLAFHPGGKHLACGTFDGKGIANLYLIEVASGEVVAKLVADPDGVGAVCFSPLGDRLAAFGSSGAVTVWDATKLLKLERD